MNQPTDATLVTGAVLIPADRCFRIFEALEQHARCLRRGGRQISPAVRADMDVLRLAAMSVRTDISWSGADMPARSGHDVLTTQQLADRLGGVTTRHALRLAAGGGIRPIRRNAWRRSDVDRLVNGEDGAMSA